MALLVVSDRAAHRGEGITAVRIGNRPSKVDRASANGDGGRCTRSDHVVRIIGFNRGGNGTHVGAGVITLRLIEGHAVAVVNLIVIIGSRAGGHPRSQGPNLAVISGGKARCASARRNRGGGVIFCRPSNLDLFCRDGKGGLTLAFGIVRGIPSVVRSHKGSVIAKGGNGCAVIAHVQACHSAARCVDGGGSGVARAHFFGGAPSGFTREVLQGDSRDLTVHKVRDAPSLTLIALVVHVRSTAGPAHADGTSGNAPSGGGGSHAVVGAHVRRRDG